MESEIKISTIIPAYNCERYIEKCINSIYNQTYKNFETIIVDDFSQDSTYEICKKLQKKFNNIKIIKLEKNMGVSDARNTGIKHAIGDYIHFIDSDDTIQENMYEEFASILQEHKYDIIISGINNIYDKKDKSVKEEPEFCIDCKNKKDIASAINNINHNDRTWFFNVVWNKLYKKDIITKNKIKFDNSINLGEDFIFNIDYFKKINDMFIINKSMYNYYLRQEESLVKKFRTDVIYRRNKVYKSLANLYEYYNINTSQNLLKLEKYEGYLSYHTIYTIFNDNCKLNQNEKKEFLKQILESDVKKRILTYLETRKYKIYEMHLIKNNKLNTLYKYMYIRNQLLNYIKK